MEQSQNILDIMDNFYVKKKKKKRSYLATILNSFFFFFLTCFYLFGHITQAEQGLWKEVNISVRVFDFLSYSHSLNA